MQQYILNPKHAAALGATSELTTKAPVGMAPPLVGAFRDAKIDRLLMNVIVNNTFWCNVMVEDVDCDTTWSIGRPIRSAAYSVLLEGAATVTEYTRVATKLEAQEVAIQGSAGLPGISAVLAGKASAEQRAKAVYSIVGEPAKGVADNLALASACIRYWVKNNGSTTTAAELAAVVASLLQKKDDQVMRVSKEARPPWLSMKVVHKFAAFQVVLCSASMLNKSLMCPVPFKIADVYDGEYSHRFHHLQYRAKTMASLGDQLRKDGIDWEEFYKVYNSIRESVSTYIRGEIVEQMDGGIMWGASGPEGKDEGREAETTSFKKIGQASVVAGGFAALGDEESEEEESEEEEAPAPAPVVSAPAPAASSKPKKEKKEEVDPELAKLMAEMEAVDNKRKEQKARKNAKSGKK